MELEKKIRNLEERLARATKREGDLENEIVRLKSSISAINSPSLTRSDIDRLLIGALDYQNLEDRFNKLKAQFGALGGLVRTQLGSLRSSGVRLEQEGGISQLLSA